MIDVHLPTTDGRELVLTRYTEPDPAMMPGTLSGSVITRNIPGIGFLPGR